MAVVPHPRDGCAGRYFDHLRPKARAFEADFRSAHLGLDIIEGREKAARDMESSATAASNTGNVRRKVQNLTSCCGRLRPRTPQLRGERPAEPTLP
ncbi:MAG: hypothetical protein M0R74_02555 [Dehalococcoidia bacterium]|nr:hypothetical protein [Dehalococcoidia bacterium]